MRRFALIMFTVVAFAAIAMAADVSGNWSGSFTPQGQDAGTAYMKLKQTGTTLSGSAGPSADEQWPLTSGKVDGNQISGVVTSTDGAVYKFVLTVDGDRISGDIDVSAGGQTIKAKLDVKRVIS